MIVGCGVHSIVMNTILSHRMHSFTYSSMKSSLRQMDGNSEDHIKGGVYMINKSSAGPRILYIAFISCQYDLVDTHLSIVVNKLIRKQIHGGMEQT
jgi:methyl coenzyme M reductase gamma subunit